MGNNADFNLKLSILNITKIYSVVSQQYERVVDLRITIKTLAKGQEETCGSDGNIVYLDCCGFIGCIICHNSLNCSL